MQRSENIYIFLIEAFVVIIYIIIFQQMEKHVERVKLDINLRPKAPLPSRAEQLKKLKDEEVRMRNKHYL